LSKLKPTLGCKADEEEEEEENPVIFQPCVRAITNLLPQDRHRK
jgi:hypothetical protein